MQENRNIDEPLLSENALSGQLIVPLTGPIEVFPYQKTRPAGHTYKKPGQSIPRL